MDPAAAVVVDKGAKRAKVGFVLGLAGILAWLLPIIGFPVTICGIIFSCLGLSSEARNKAVVGLTLSIIFLIVTLLNSIVGASMAVILDKNEANIEVGGI
jgi:hypothetical protein